MRKILNEWRKKERWPSRKLRCCLAVTAIGDAKARVEDDLARVLDALVTAKEDGYRSEAEIARLAIELTSLLL